MSNPVLDAKLISSYCLCGENDPQGLKVQLGQTEHRINLINSWGIAPGEKVLELGCGQGDCSVSLAAAVGETGKVVAVDPGRLDYGSPFTLAQAQNHLIQSPVGSQLSFVQANPVEFLEKASETKYDSAILAHCIYYFASPSVLLSTFSALKPHTKRICVAEYALSSSRPEGYPHVLAALALATLDAAGPEGQTEGNIRTLFTPPQIKAAAEQVGLQLVKEDIVAAPDGMFDGKWEVGSVLSDHFGKEVDVWIKDPRQRAIIHGIRDALKTSVKNVGQKNLKTMDVWVAVFEVV